MNIVCFGDSITHASDFPECDKWPVILQFKLDAVQPGAHKVYNRGIGGDSTPHALRRIREAVLPLLPGLVLVEFGINDRGNKDWIQVEWVSLAEYERNLAAIHDVVKRHGGRAIFLVNHPLQSEPKYPVAADLSLSGMEHPFDTAVRRTAQACDAALIDLPRILRKSRVTAAQLLSKDGCHLSAEGNHHYAAAVFQGLQGLL